MIKHLALQGRLAVPSLFLLLLLSFSACQQSNEPSQNAGNETVSGVLQDEQGLSLPEALVEALNAQSLVVASDTADEDGKFSFDLPIDASGMKLRVTRGDLKPFVRDLAEFIQKAGSKSGLILEGEHSDSCCGKIGLTISGGNESINHAEVKLRQGGHLISKGYTNDNGKITFGHVCAGEYDIRIAKDGFKVKEFELTVGEDCDSVGFAYELESNGTTSEDTCCGSTASFVIKDSASNEILNGVQIKLRKGDHYVIKNTENGGANFAELCEGVYAVRIAREGYKVMEFSIEVGCNTETDLTKWLSKIEQEDDSCCNGQITILGKKSGGDIIEGAKVKLYKGSTLLRTETMHDGVTWKELCEGNYSASITAEGYNGVEFSFELGCNDTAETITKTLTAKATQSDSCCHGVLYLTVNEDGSSTKIANATVKLWKGGAIFKTGTTNGDGLVKIEGICEGTYGVSIIREGYNGKEFDGVEFGCNDTVELSKAIVKKTNEACCTASLKLRIKDATAMTYLEGATVKIYKGNDLVATVTSGDEGWAFKEGLCNGNTYTVVISKDGYVAQEVNFTYNECKLLTETIMLVQE